MTCLRGLPREDAGADYVDVARDSSFGRPGIMKFLEDPSLEHPPFAPPFLKAGKLLISLDPSSLNSFSSAYTRIISAETRAPFAAWIADAYIPTCCR